MFKKKIDSDICVIHLNCVNLILSHIKMFLSNHIYLKVELILEVFIC